jgi:hypothetical protein
MGENQTIVLVEFSTLSLTVSVKSETTWAYTVMPISRAEKTAQLRFSKVKYIIWDVQKLTGENLTVVRAEFSNLSLAVFVKSETVWTYTVTPSV